MPVRKFCLPSLVLAAIVLAGNLAWALGLELGETKEQLKLKYDVAVVDHGTGRVTVTLTMADEGRLAPLDRGVGLVIPSKDRSGYVDLSLSLERRKDDGKQVMSVHLTRELAERAKIHLSTDTLDGKQQPLTWYYHSIPIAKYLKEAGEKKK
ncbi:MAG: hypothetical protein ACR2FY_13645 [Pirellulaceae bacterium]